jgi:nicotinate-nucleotide pyrophosphorylase (carboxylating)
VAIVQSQPDIRDTIFSGIAGKKFHAQVIAEQDGIVAGTARLLAALAEHSVRAELRVAAGAELKAGDCVLQIEGTAKQIAVAEEFVIGMLAKPSGIATAAHQAVQFAGHEIKIVCGAWKKMPPEIKGMVREAVTAGGAACRITDQPFLYLDKNFVRMLGGIAATLQAVAPIKDKLKVIQLKGECADIATEAMTAVQHGADILMIDTGVLADQQAAHTALRDAGWRERVKLAFAKGIRMQDVREMRGQGIDILDIGVAIVDAPLLDMKLEVREGLHATQSAGKN